MPVVDIYQNDKKITTEELKGDFYIVEDSSSGEIFWESDSNTRAGIIKSWIIYGNTDPLIRIVLPDWQLTIDGVDLERKFYDEVPNLKGKIVELTHNEFRFVFRFDENSVI